MHVKQHFRGQWLGTKIVKALEEIALGNGAVRIILQARENALQFYKNNNYEIVEKSYILFDKIQHWLMKKELFR